MTDPNPRVSLVLPAYNAAPYVSEAIDSLLKQDYENLDVLVLDDGSTDDTRQILESYTGRIRWESQANMGQAATLNKGWRVLGGQVLGYLSADDVLFPNAVSTVVRALCADDNLALAYPDYELIDGTGSRLRRVQAPEYDYREMLVKLVCPPGPGALFRRTAAVSAGWWDPTLSLVPDWDFWLRLGLHGHGRRVPEVLAGFRVHDTSQTFRSAAPEVSEEYPRVSERHFATQPVPPELLSSRLEALSSAHLYAARSHLRSARYGTALARAAKALQMHPRNARPSMSRVVVHGLVNAVRYRQRGPR